MVQNHWILKRAVQTCAACPSQWDAWDVEGNYWYLRYRNSIGTAERQPSEDIATWQNKTPEIVFDTDRGRYHGTLSLAEFCEAAGIRIHPEAEIIPPKSPW